MRYLLFPELGALSYDVLRNPHGRWAQSGPHLVLMPFLAAVVGVLSLRLLGGGVLSLLVTTVVIATLLRFTDSPVTPAVSAALLAIVLQTRSPWYPISVLAGTSMLALVLAMVRRTRGPSPPIVRSHNVRGPAVLATLILIALTLALGSWTGLRLIFFPPLAVIALETFGHDRCPWRRRREAVPIALTLVALLATAPLLWLGPGVPAALVGVVGALAVQRAFRLSMPPLMAVALLPNLLSHHILRYPLAIAAGASLLWLIWWLMDTHFEKPQSPSKHGAAA